MYDFRLEEDPRYVSDDPKASPNGTFVDDKFDDDARDEALNGDKLEKEPDKEGFYLNREAESLMSTLWAVTDAREYESLRKDLTDGKITMKDIKDVVLSRTEVDRKNPQDKRQAVQNPNLFGLDDDGNPVPEENSY